MVNRVQGSNLTEAALAGAPGPASGTVLRELFDTIDDLDKQGKKVLKVSINKPLEYVRDQFQDLSQEQAQALQDSLDASNKLANWSYGAFISSVLYATSSILGGYYLRVNGKMEEGNQFIYSGMALLANALLEHTGGWGKLANVLSFGNKNVEQVLTAVLPIATTFFTYAWNARKVAQLPGDLKEKIGNLETLFKFVNCTILAGQLYMKFWQGQADRRLLDVDTQMNVKNLEITQILLRRGVIQDSFDSIKNALRGIVKNMFNTTADFAKNN